MNNTINEINNKLNNAVSDVNELNKCMRSLSSLKDQRIALNKKLDELTSTLKKEEKDVEKLMKLSFSNFIHTIMKDKEDVIEKEKREALAAKLKVDEILDEISYCNKNIANLESKIKLLSTANETYDKLFEEKRKFIELHMPSKWSEIESLTKEELSLDNDLKEVKEAINAGNVVISNLNSTNSLLNSAENWGTWDIIGGGMMSTMIKRDKMREAQESISLVQHSLKRFANELKDVSIDINVDLTLDSFLGFADYIFDGFFVDLAVQSKIHQAQNKVNQVNNQVNSILRKLNLQLSTLNQKKKDIDNKSKSLIEQL